MHQVSQSEFSNFDISTSKLWYAIVLLSKRNFTSALSIVNGVISSIPPFPLTSIEPYNNMYYHTEAKQLYADTFLNSGITPMERARKAWLMPLIFDQSMADVVPLAIQIELYFSFTGHVTGAVFTLVMIYYLAFQCYHELGQYEQRNNALRQLVDHVNTDESHHDGIVHSYNIAGHCFLIAGEKDRARDMFMRSKYITQRLPNPLASSSKWPHASIWYLENFCK